MKKLARFLAFSLIFTGLSNIAGIASTNTDAVGSSLYADWGDVGAKYKDAVLLLSVHADGLNVFQGSSGRFFPKSTFTRAEAISLVAVVAIGGNHQKLELNTLFASDAAREPIFTDVNQSHWAYGAINYAYRMRLVEGTGGGNFNPSDAVTKDMVNSMLLGLLGVAADDKNGPDWITKTNVLMKTLNVKLDADIVNYHPTREEVASALNVAVHSNLFTRDMDTGIYIRQSNTLKQSAFGSGGSGEEEGAITITGKVIGTKYANLFGVNNFNKNVLLEGVGVNDGLPNGTIFRLEMPERDDVVPVALLGRVVTLRVVKISEGLYRTAIGAKAVPLYKTDVVALPLNNDGSLNRTLYDNACAEIPTASTAANNYAGIRGNTVQFRGAYTNYGAAGGYSADWQPRGNWTYAYAVTFGNTNFYSEVYFLNYRAMMVHDLYPDGTITFKALDGISSAGVNSMKTNNFENGRTLAMGDIIIAVVDANNNIVTAEKMTSRTGIKQGNLINGGVVAGGVSYDIWDNYINYANQQMPGSWGSGLHNWIQLNSFMTYWAFRPVYGEYTGAAARIFHSSTPGEYKDRWIEWDQPEQQPENYCIVINVEEEIDGVYVTIVAVNGMESRRHKLNSLYVREVIPSGWLSSDKVMSSTFAEKPIQFNNPFTFDATQGITGGTNSRVDRSNGLFWTKPNGADALANLSGINIYSYKISNRGIDLYEWDASVDSDVRIIKVSKDHANDKIVNMLIVENHSKNSLLYSQGRAAKPGSGNFWLLGEEITKDYAAEKYTFVTSDAVWFSIGANKNPTVLKNWEVSDKYSGTPPASYILIFTRGDRVEFIIYEEKLLN